MMKEYNEETQVAKAAVKVARTALRLKYALLADDELARKLPDIEKAVIAARAEGRPFEVDVAALFSDGPEALA